MLPFPLDSVALPLTLSLVLFRSLTIVVAAVIYVLHLNGFAVPVLRVVVIVVAAVIVVAFVAVVIVDI